MWHILGFEQLLDLAQPWGPVFPPMFNTLSIVFTMVHWALLLGESVTLGEEFNIKEEEDLAMILTMHINKKPKHGGSVMGWQKIWRDRIDAHNRLMRHYFMDNPVYPESYFWRQFRMSTELFRRIVEKLPSHDRFSQQRRNAAGELWHITFQKVTAALHMLAYGIPIDLVDDHLAMGESQAIMCVKCFAIVIVQVFGPEYLRSPNAKDAARLLEMNKARGFPANGHTYNYDYYLADGIYPKWQTFVKPLKKPEDPMAMWHVRAEIAPAILLVVDFGGWYKLDSKSAGGNSSHMIQHTQVSLLKDIIVPYTHLLPTLRLSENMDRPTLLYFKGAKHRHRDYLSLYAVYTSRTPEGGLVREKLWDLMVNEPDVVMEEGFPNATGREQSIKGMRTSEFCLHPAGDTPSSCRLFDAVASLCIPVIVSDDIELPFEGMIDYTEFSIFVSVGNAMRPKWLTDYLRNISKQQKDEFRRNLAGVQHIFEYENSHQHSKVSAPEDGAVNHIWKKIHQKLPMIQEAVTREKRKPEGASIPLRCHCT
ncbi:putative glucuronosyltransferase GUT1 [Triticum urartu]|uniref:Putative glucuronosyltransferase GUT1 n=1 Tax=Triticum urartu TaxID=4572 RepID=M7Z7M5_TRIUA|nr:putative glucuronosyltransferase GUT1 [Triticum urartu]